MGRLDICFLMVGDEILQGFTTDTNSTFLAQRLTQMGHKVRRILIVEDDVNAIVSNIGALLRSKPDILFVCGGLGGTPDDVTIDAICKALELPLVRSRKAYAWIKEKVDGYHSRGRLPSPDMSGAHSKMAMVPKGSKVLFNGQGTAPGLVISAGPGPKGTRQRVIVLPGVPRELKDIFDHQIDGKVIRPAMVRPSFKEITVRIPESMLEPFLKRFLKENPDVTIGSYPQDDKRVILRISGAKRRVQESLKVIRKEITALGTQNRR